MESPGEGRTTPSGQSDGDGQSDEGASLTVEISHDGEQVLVSLGGELDISNVAGLDRRLEEALSGRPASLVFDLSGLRFLDSSGIGLLLRASSRVGSVQLRRPSQIVEQVIRHMGLAEVLSIEP